VAAAQAELGAVLSVTAPAPPVAAALRHAATFRNPARARAERFGGRGPRHIPECIALWRVQGPVLTVPRGLLPVLLRTAPLCPVADRRVTLAPVDFAWRGELRPEQERCCRAARGAGGGVIVGPCGSGKTVLGLAAAAGWGQPCLWIVHTTDLARQALERAGALFDLPPGAVGLLGAGHETLGTHLTVATVQTLARRDLARLAPRFGTVILDEAHHAPAATFLHVLQAFPARNLLGLTATPDRADGLGPVMLAVLGPVSSRLSAAALASAGRVLVPEVRQVATGFRFRYREDYRALLDALCGDGPRNALVAGAVAAEAKDGHRCLVLSERVAHLHALAAALTAAAPEIPAAVLTGEAPARRREEVLQALRDGHLSVLFATRLADEGLDVPALDRLFLTSGGRDPNRVAQQVGRVARPAEGKGTPLVLDFCDLQVGVLAAQARARVREVYLPMGARVRAPATGD
jgi:superfamily II DNA or RNA helicase